MFRVGPDKLSLSSWALLCGLPSYAIANDLESFLQSTCDLQHNFSSQCVMCQLTNTTRQMLGDEEVLLCTWLHSALHSSYHGERWNNPHFTQSLSDLLDLYGQQGTESRPWNFPVLSMFSMLGMELWILCTWDKPSISELCLHLFEYSLEMA